MKKITSRIAMLSTFLRKINFTKVEPKVIVAPALAQKSSDWILLG